jgi:hypothetical protein
MTKSIKTNRISAAFLAVVLVAGTFAMIVPSFMGGAQAEPDYGMKYEKDYGYEKPYKSHEKPYYEKPKYPSYKPDYSKSKNSVDIKKIKCNNVNVNLNDINANIELPTEEPEEPGGGGGEGIAASAFGNNERNNNFGQKNNFKHFDKDFVFVCINNNNNGGADGDDGGNGGDGERTDICHYPRGNPGNVQILSLPPAGAEAHLERHQPPGWAGDEILPASGVCPDKSSPPAD